MGRPPVALGIWPDMIQAASGVQALALRLGMTERGLRWVFTGQRSLQGRNAAAARAFARLHDIGLRAYRHPSSGDALLVSSASGWFLVPAEPGGWDRAVVARRQPSEDWSSLSALEVDFASTWPSISPWEV
jgi:hypothetical protein